MKRKIRIGIFAKMMAATGGGALALLSIAGGASAVQLVFSENADTDTTPGAGLVVEPLNDEQRTLARKIAEEHAEFSTLIKQAGIDNVLSAPVHNTQGEIESVLLTYELSKPYSGSTTEFVQLLPREVAAAKYQFQSSDWNLTIRSASRIDVVVDTSSNKVWSIMPGFGTAYERPEAGQSVVTKDGTIFKFTTDNFEYDANTGGIVIETLIRRIGEFS